MTLRPARLLPAGAAARLVLAACAAAFLAERAAEAAGVAPGWAAGRLDDLVCLPLVLTAALAVHRAAGRPASWRLPAGHALAVAAGYAVFFELVLPRLDPRAVGDWGDAAAYAAGTALFLLAINGPGRAAGPAAGPRPCDPGRPAASWEAGPAADPVP